MSDKERKPKAYTGTYPDNLETLTALPEIFQCRFDRVTKEATLTTEEDDSLSGGEYDYTSNRCSRSWLYFLNFPMAA